ncbi:helicase associated domain-containing protein [Streptomyces sp. MBT27]|uniref:helicase associated domain-containing protein n=1 Tax=Streptomyces sp. MBT27 TaxID=1488356 RepID=UPI001F0787C9|nr:helicase associated domain-containing protein [Streptomyces sp. MBT27]
MCGRFRSRTGPWACGAGAGAAPPARRQCAVGGSLSRAEQAYRVGLAHARSYAARHGHLAVPKYGRHEGFALGAWLANQRIGVAALPIERATGV